MGAQVVTDRYVFGFLWAHNKHLINISFKVRAGLNLHFPSRRKWWIQQSPQGPTVTRNPNPEDQKLKVSKVKNEFSFWSLKCSEQIVINLQIIPKKMASTGTKWTKMVSLFCQSESHWATTTKAEVWPSTKQSHYFHWWWTPQHGLDTMTSYTRMVGSYDIEYHIAMQQQSVL